MKDTVRRTIPRGLRLRPARWAMYAILVVGAFVSLTPFLWMLSSSFMTQGETIRRVVLPSELQWSNYVEAWREARFGLYFRNSLIIAAIQVSGMMLFCTLAAYPLARMRFTGRNAVFIGILATLMIPESVTMVPQFLMVSWLNQVSWMRDWWMNNWPAQTIPFMASAFGIFLLRQSFAGIPSELWDAARIDGAGHLRFLFTVVVPLSKAPLLTVGMLTFISSWNALAWPLLVTNTPRWRPISVGLQQFVSEAGPEVHLQMAGAVIAMVPVLLAFFLMQKEFTEGIARAGLKG